MNILVLNCGSSSIKYSIIEMESERATVRGTLERLGQPRARLTHDVFGRSTVQIERDVTDHADGIALILATISHPEYGALASLAEIGAVGHRVVHGGTRYTGSVPITEDVVAALHQYADLAPLHNPPNLAGIEACQRAMSAVPQVAVFDTAFHQSLPAHSFTYALPQWLAKKHGLRRYGFHGIAFRWATQRASELLDVPLTELKVVTLMLGSGCTVNALQHGQSVDVSTGFTPLEGLMQSTRSGDVDAGMVLWLMECEGLTPAQMSGILYRQSGWTGIAGIGPDLREVITAARNGNADAQCALDTFVYRCKKYLGAYAAAMGGLDVVVFSGGIGEKSPPIREKICEGLGFLGVALDAEANRSVGADKVISSADSRVRTVVVVMNEELVIARDTRQLIS